MLGVEKNFDIWKQKIFGGVQNKRLKSNHDVKQNWLLNNFIGSKNESFSVQEDIVGINETLFTHYQVFLIECPGYTWLPQRLSWKTFYPGIGEKIKWNAAFNCLWSWKGVVCWVDYKK